MAVLAAVAFGQGALAQGATQAAAEASKNPAGESANGMVDEVIVTAQKRAQNLQDVPIVVTVVSAQQLQDAGVRDIKDLAVVTPGLNVTASTSDANTTARIRGIGTIGDNPGLESSVGVVIDGIYRSRTGVAFGDLGELERVEVLKGPQGTLFGKNTSAGVLNVITKRPSFTFGGNAEATFGNYGMRGGSASVTGPIIADKLAGRLFIADRHRDGYYDVRLGEGPRTKTDDNNQDYITARAQLLWKPVSAVEVLVLGDYSNRYERCCLAVDTVGGSTVPLVDSLATDAGTLQPANPFARIAYANRSTDQKIQDGGGSIQVDWRLNDQLKLTSITAARHYGIQGGQDSDFSSADIWYRTPDDFQTKFDTFTQELRLAGSTEKLEWLVGGYYVKEDLDQRSGIFFGPDYEPFFGLLLSAGRSPTTVSTLTGRPFGTNFIAGQGALDTYSQTTNSFALYTNDSYRLTDKLELTVGLRYTTETKELDTHYTNTSPGNACRAAAARPLPAAAISAICAPSADFAFDDARTHQTHDENRLTGTAKLAYRFNPSILSYVSYAKGFKSGGFNLDRARKGPGVIDPSTEFPAETVDSYEVGLKTNTANRRLTVNAAVFHQTFNNFQLNTYTGISFLVAPIPEVVSRGLDLDVTWRTPIPGLRIGGGVTYAETQYGQFVPPAGISARLPGTRISYGPLYSASGTISYEHPLPGDLELRTSLVGKFTSDYNTGSNLDPLKVQQDLLLLNARVAIGDRRERWAVELWAQNLTDEDYLQVAADKPLQAGSLIGFLGAPRTFGVTLRGSF